MEPELPGYTRPRYTRTSDRAKTSAKQSRTRRLLRSNTTGIVYFLVMSHGSIFGKETGGKIQLKMTKIPKKMKLFNKLTYALVGHPNWGTTQIEKDQIEEYTRRFAEFNEPGNSPLIGDDLKEFIQDFETYKPKMQILKDALREDGISGVKPLISRPKSLFQVSLNNTYTDKIFMRDPKSDNETTDIFVVFAKGGTPGKQFAIGDQILKNRNTTRSYEIRGQVITLKELLNMSLNRGYNKVVMIDYSCESCYQIEEEHDAFTPSYEYVNAEDESPGRILERMPHVPFPVSSKLLKESDALYDEIFELEEEADKLAKQSNAAEKLRKVEEAKQELNLKLQQLHTEISTIQAAEIKEWDEKYATSYDGYQYAKPKQGTPITDPAQILKLERRLSRTKTRGGK